MKISGCRLRLFCFVFSRVILIISSQDINVNRPIDTRMVLTALLVGMIRQEAHGKNWPALFRDTAQI